MNVDHVSREPDDPSNPPGPPPIGECGDAARNLFAPRAGVRPVPPGPPGYDLRPLVMAAVILHGGQRNNTLTAKSFGEIIRLKFDLEDAPGAPWCRRVLRGLDYITAYPGDHYRVQG